MAAPAAPRPISVLVVNLAAALVLGLFLFSVFTIFNHFFLTDFNEPEILLLEAGGILLVAFLVGRAVTGAANAVMARRGGASRVHAVRLFLNLIIAIGAVLALFRLAGVSIESIFLGSALAGIVLGLAAQTVLANVFAGLLLVVADPFRPGDRVAIVSGSYGAIGPSYPHEMMYPSYSGTVADVGLIYTVLHLDTGGTAQVPNSVVLGALVLRRTPGISRSVRVRMTFPLTVGVATVEAALAELAKSLPRDSPLTPLPRLEVCDISAATWDGVAVVWSSTPDETTVRDTVLRSVLGRLPGTPRAS
jgi:small conductance mechanosensitive channel